MNSQTGRPGRTQDFVLGQGFREILGALRLVDADGFGRGFLELASDPDHPQSRPEEAYERLLASLKPGGEIRVLQIRWPEPGPRLAFYENAAAWPAAGPSDGLQGEMHAELLRFLRRNPLPFQTRTVLEFVLRTEDDVEWFEAAVDLLGAHQIEARPLTNPEVQMLAHFIFHPEPG